MKGIRYAARNVLMSFAILMTLLFLPVAVQAGTTANTRPEIFLEFASEKAPMDISKVSIRVDGVDVTSKSTLEQWRISYVPLMDLAEGKHDVLVVVYDMEGNRGEKSWSFNVDTSITKSKSPRIVFAPPTPSNGSVIGAGGQVLFAVNVLDAGAGYEKGSLKAKLTKDGSGDVRLGEPVLESNIYRYDVPETVSGRYLLEASLTDAAGNISNKEEVAFTIDSDAPVVSYFSVTPKMIKRDGDLLVMFSVSDFPRANIDSCSLSAERNGEVVFRNPYRSVEGKNVIRLKMDEIDKSPSGTYSLSLICEDTAGNESAAVQPQTIEVETGIDMPHFAATPIEMRRKGDFYIDTLPEITSNRRISVSGQAPAGSPVEIYLDGAPTTRIDSESSGRFISPAINLNEGMNFVSASVESSNGDESARTDEIPVLLDTIAPAISIATPADGASIDAQSFSVGFSVDDFNGSGVDDKDVRVSIDGRAVSGLLSVAGAYFSADHDMNGQSGQHSMEIEVLDAAGNKSVASSRFQLVVPQIPQEPVVEPVVDPQEPPVVTPPVVEPEEPPVVTPDVPPVFPEPDPPVPDVQPPVQDVDPPASEDDVQPGDEGGEDDTDIVNPDDDADDDLGDISDDDDGGQDGESDDSEISDDFFLIRIKKPFKRNHACRGYVRIHGKVPVSGISIELCVNGDCKSAVSNGNGGFKFGKIKLDDGINDLSLSVDINGTRVSKEFTIECDKER